MSENSYAPPAERVSLSALVDTITRTTYQKTTTAHVDEGLARWLLGRCGFDQETIERQIAIHRYRLWVVHEAAATAIAHHVLSSSGPRTYAYIVAGLSLPDPKALRQVAADVWLESDTVSTADRNTILERIGESFLALMHVTSRKPDLDPDAPNALDLADVRSTVPREDRATVPAA
jgi:hypothetical protein